MLILPVLSVWGTFVRPRSAFYILSETSRFGTFRNHFRVRRKPALHAEPHFESASAHRS